MRFRPDSSQMIWDWAVAYFAETPMQCVVPGMGHRYLRPDGHRCVIGSMLEPETPRDQQFMLEFFGSVFHLADLNEGTTKGYGIRNFDWVSYDDLKLLAEIQIVHDRSTFWNPPYGLNDLGWHRMVSIAKEYDLSTDYLEDLRRGID